MLHNVGAESAHTFVVQGSALNDLVMVKAPQVHIPFVAVGTPQAGTPWLESDVSNLQLNNLSKCCGGHAIGGHTLVSD